MLEPTGGSRAGPLFHITAKRFTARREVSRDTLVEHLPIGCYPAVFDLLFHDRGDRRAGAFHRPVGGGKIRGGFVCGGNIFRTASLQSLRAAFCPVVTVAMDGEKN